MEMVREQRHAFLKLSIYRSHVYITSERPHTLFSASSSVWFAVDTDGWECVSGARHWQKAHGGVTRGEPDPGDGSETEYGWISASGLGARATVQNNTWTHSRYTWPHNHSDDWALVVTHSVVLLFSKGVVVSACLVCVCTAVPQKSLGQEVNELATSQLLRLEKENQMLLKTVEEMKASCESQTLLRLEEDNQILSQKVRQASGCF